MTFPKFQNQEFWTQFEYKFFKPKNGGIIKKLVRDPILLNIRINPEDELFILKIERVTVIFVSQVGRNLNFLKKIKYQNLSQFLRLSSEFLHVISIFIEFQTLNSNMVSQSTPLLIF